MREKGKFLLKEFSLPYRLRNPITILPSTQAIREALDETRKGDSFRLAPTANCFDDVRSSRDAKRTVMGVSLSMTAGPTSLLRES